MERFIYNKSIASGEQKRGDWKRWKFSNCFVCLDTEFLHVFRFPPKITQRGEENILCFLGMARRMIVDTNESSEKKKGKINLSGISRFFYSYKFFLILKCISKLSLIFFLECVNILSLNFRYNLCNYCGGFFGTEIFFASIWVELRKHLNVHLH